MSENATFEDQLARALLQKDVETLKLQVHDLSVNQKNVRDEISQIKNKQDSLDSNFLLLKERVEEKLDTNTSSLKEVQVEQKQLNKNLQELTTSATLLNHKLESLMAADDESEPSGPPKLVFSEGTGQLLLKFGFGAIILIAALVFGESNPNIANLFKLLLGGG